MHIQQIKDKIIFFRALENPTREQIIYLRKLESAERLSLHVVPHLVSINGHEIEFQVTETNEDATNERLDWAGIDGLFAFKHVGISAAYASRTWTLTDETPTCGGALVRFCRDRGTTEHEMRLRFQRQIGSEDELRIKTEKEQKLWIKPRPVKFQEEAIKLMTGDLLGLPGTFTANYFVSSYFRNDAGRQSCTRFSIVPIAELRMALQQLYSETLLGNDTLLDRSREMIAHWRSPYVMTRDEFALVERSLARDPRVTLIKMRQGNSGFVRFLYLNREFLESVCPSFQVWEAGVLQPRSPIHPTPEIVPEVLNDAEDVSLNSLMLIPTLEEPVLRALVVTDPEPPTIDLAPAQPRRWRLRAVAAIVLICAAFHWLVPGPVALEGSAAAVPVLPPLSKPVSVAVSQEPQLPSPQAARANAGRLPKRKIDSSSRQAPGHQEEPERGIMTALTASAIREAARAALDGRSVPWAAGTAFGYATLATAGTFDERGCPRFRISRNDLSQVEFQEYALCEVMVPR